MNTRRRSGKPALELIEEAVQRVRLAPASALAAYYAGTLPFVLGLLYFWSDMSRSPVAHQHLAEAALGLALLFVWMKFWQAIFARQMRAIINGSTAGMTRSELWRVLFSQAALQPLGLLLLPLSALFVLPFPWAYAFYQNLTALGSEEFTGLGDLAKKALRQAAFWPGQVYLVLLLLGSFGFCVLVNWSVVCYVLPGLAQSLLGLQTSFSRSGPSVLNTTFFAAMLSLTYLSLDPLLKTVYVLRCFYGASLKSGDDLKAEFRELAQVGRRATIGLVLLALLFPANLGAAAAGAAAPPLAESEGGPAASVPPAGPGPVSPSGLEQEIERVIRQTKYTWRTPREKLEPESDPGRSGLIERFLASVRSMVVKFLDWVGDWVRKLRERPRGSVSGGSVFSQQFLMLALILAAAIALAILVLRLARGRRPGPATVASEPMAPAPDLADEALGADQLPEDGWTRLARELLERGELRLALRAFYFASLAHLAGRNLIRLVKSKSNREYERELGRRGHAFPQLVSVFGENVSLFDRSWYGLHDVNAELVRQFADNVERIKTGA